MPQSSIDLIVVMNLKTALKRRGRSAYSIATALGHPNNWLYQVLNQKSGLLIPSLRKIAKELGVSPGSLIDAPQDIPNTNGHVGPDASITGHRLAKTREKLGRTQSELAAALGAPTTGTRFPKWKVDKEISRSTGQPWQRGNSMCPSTTSRA